MDELESILRQLSDDQLRYVQAGMYARNKKAAAEGAGVGYRTIYNWTPEDMALIEKAITLSRLDGVILAREKLRRFASDAIDVIIDETKARRGSSKRLEAAKEALDRIGITGKTVLELQGQVRLLKGYATVSPDDWDDKPAEPASTPGDSTA